MDAWNPSKNQCDGHADCKDQFEDLSGAPIDTTNFAGANPDADSSSNQCLRMKSDGKLQDSPCTNERKVLCESTCNVTGNIIAFAIDDFPT